MALSIKDLDIYAAEIMVHDIKSATKMCFYTEDTILTSKKLSIWTMPAIPDTCAHSDNPQYFDRKLMPNSHILTGKLSECECG